MRCVMGVAVHDKWKDVNLAATVPGWQRFEPCMTFPTTSPPPKRATVISCSCALRPAMRRPTTQTNRSVRSSSSLNGIGSRAGSEGLHGSSPSL